MRDTSTRVFSFMCVLVAVWVSVYWFYDRGEPPVTFDDRAAAPSETPIQRDPLAQLTSETAKPAAPLLKPTRTEPATKKPADRLPAGVRVIPPTFTEYVVQPRDTFQSIAKKMFGDSKYGRAIGEANKFVDPLRLIPGRTVLRIPTDPNNVEGIVVREGQAESLPPQRPITPNVVTPKVQPESAPANAGYTEYVITREDTLSSIAKAFYGKASLWREIYESNTDVIPDADHLKVGTTIRIPKR